MSKLLFCPVEVGCSSDMFGIFHVEFLRVVSDKDDIHHSHQNDSGDYSATKRIHFKFRHVDSAAKLH